MFATQAQPPTLPPPPCISDMQPIDPHETDPDAVRARRREWNRHPLTELFPRIPSRALERVLDLCIDKSFTYNTSQSRLWNARRYSSIVVAHVRHFYTPYDRLLREDGLERFAARRATGDAVWKVLKQWCPWDKENEVLEKCFQATLLRPEERDPEWDPMDIDDESFYASTAEGEVDDPMDLD